MSKETTEIPNSFIKLAHKSACPGWKKKIEEVAPAMFYKHLSPGVWVKMTNQYGAIPVGAVLRVERHQGGDFWVLGHNDFLATAEGGRSYLAPDSNDFVLATKNEVSIALLAEAKKRGFTMGSRYKDVDTLSPSKVTQKIEGDLELKGFDNTIGTNHVSIGDGYGGYVYCEGNWSTPILKIMTKVEAEEKLNCVIEG